MQSTTASPEGQPVRARILMSAFLEFYRNGFQGGSLNSIVAAAGVTKGALFHQFAGKQELGYAVVDEVIAPLLRQRWLDELAGSPRPVEAIQNAFRRYIEEDIASGAFVQGCPMNNLAQEMSPLDHGFRSRIDSLYSEWRSEVGRAVRAGIEAGSVRTEVDPDSIAVLIVLAQMGIWGTGKASQDPALMRASGEALCNYLQSQAA
jgi:TetR/AcrR family transcriptional regulator, transcriptional repressor for nem operon